MPVHSSATLDTQHPIIVSEMSKPGEVVLSATERMLVEKQKAEIRRMRMSKEQLELFRLRLKMVCRPDF